MPLKPESVAAAAEADAADAAEAAAKSERKAAKRAAKEAAAAAEAQEVDEAEAKRQRKAARKAAREAAAAEAEDGVEDDEAEAKRLRKAAKKAAKEAAAAAAMEDEAAAPAKKEKRGKDAEEDDEAPKAKKNKVENEENEKEEADADKSTSVEENKSLKVFIKGLPYSVDEDTLRKDFAECGEITHLQLPMNEEGKPKGFAFIQFASQDGFDAALKYDNMEYGGRYINVLQANDTGKGKSKDSKGKGKGKVPDWNCPSCDDLQFGRNTECRKCGTARPAGLGPAPGSEATERDNVNTVFVRGLPWSVTEEALRKDFAECGEIENLRFLLNEEGKPRGISFIKYKTEEGVEAALKFDNTDYEGRTINVCKAGEGKGKDGKSKGKDGKAKGKDGKGKDGKGKAKGKSKGKGKAPSESFAKSSGCIIAGAGEKTTFADSDDE